MEFREISPACGTEVLGIDLRERLEASAERELRAEWLRRGLLLFRKQELSIDDLERTAQIFGEVTHESYFGRQKPYVSNVVPDGLVPNGELRFHSDKPFTKEPLRGLMLYAYEAPPEGAGGETVFANVHLAYERLPAGLRKRIRDLRIVHYSYRRATHPIVYSHPVTGEKILFYSAQFFERFVGLDLDEAQALREELAGQIEDREVTYAHAWRPGDLIAWDNIKLQHARTNFDPKHRRHLHRTQIGPPLVAAAS